MPVRAMAPNRSSVAGQHAADQEIGDLGRRDVDHAGDEAAVDQLLHRPAAGAGGVEHEAIVVRLERLNHRLHAGCRDAEHGEPQRGLVRRRRPRHGIPHHARQRVRGVAQHLA